MPQAVRCVVAAALPLVIGVSSVAPTMAGRPAADRQSDGPADGRPDRRPNLIVILADDMGYSDLGCTGSEIRTPHLDSMARAGLLFTHCYNTSRCCPSRAALLTGQYQWDAGMGHMNTARTNWPEYQQALSRDTVTVAEVLREHGYATLMSGKWHVGDERGDWPDRRGFEQFYGTPTGGGLYFYPSPFYDRPVFRNGERVTPPDGWYSTDGFTDYVIDALTDRDDDRPFFLYLAYIAPHFPLQARDEDIRRYEGVYDVGYRAIRKARFARQQQLGVVSADCKLSPAVTPKWESVDQSEQARRMAVYAAQVDRLDQNVGRLLQTLQTEDLLDNTLIMFLSDNGGCANGFNKTPQAVIGTRDSNAAYGKWYNVSNTPYRQAKAQEHEGGILTPLVVQWPAGVRAAGGLVTQPVHIMDIMPTCLELAQVSCPNVWQGRPLDPVDGVSFAGLLRNERPEQWRERTLCWEHEGNRAIRRGRWKLVALRKKPWELYDLREDPAELHNLAAARADLVRTLSAAYAQWAADHGVRPWPLRAGNNTRSAR